MEVIAKSTGLFVTIVALGSILLWAQDVIRIGAIFSLTGPMAEVAEVQKRAVKMAVKEVNDAGGVEMGAKKVRIKAVFGDDQTKPEIATQLFEDMIKNKQIAVVIGGTEPHITLALNSAAKKHKVFLMSACATPDAFHEQKVKAPAALGIVEGASDMGRAGASYVMDKIKPKKVACFMPSYPFGNAMAAGVETVIKKYPEITYKIFWHPFGSSNIRHDLEPVRDFKPDIILIGSWGQDAVNAFNQAFEMGLGKDSKLFHLWTVNAMATAIQPEAIKGVRAQMLRFYDMSGFRDNSVVKATNEFSANYAKLYNEPSDAYALASYEAVKEIARAIKLCQSTDPTKMYEALLANPVWTGAKGEAKWRKDGRCMYKYFDWIVEGKGAAEYKERAFGNQYDYAKVVDVFTGDAFAPTLQEWGY